MCSRASAPISIAFAVLLCATSGIAVAQPKERKNIDSLTAEELAKYRHAVDVLRNSLDPDNNYDYHADLHNLFLSSPPHGCEHGNDLFFPWHRYHLYNFEHALQASDPNHATLSTKEVTIPYWNWSEQASGERYPTTFEEELDATGHPNPLHDFRNPGATGPFFDANYFKNLIDNNSDWNDFAGGIKGSSEFYGALELPAHNDMHSEYIGGNMGNPTQAAMDPIYWSFHAFIDMQWDRWQKTYNKPPTSQSAVLQGFVGAPTVAETVKVEDLNYFYTHPPDTIEPVEAVQIAAAKAEVQQLSSTVVAAEKIVARWGGSGPFEFTLPEARERFTRADLWLKEVSLPQATSYRLEVYIHPIDQDYQPSDRAGYFSVWQGHKSLSGSPHHTHGNMFLTITDPLRQAIAANPGKKLAVTLVPVPVKNRSPKPAAAQAEPIPLIDEIQFKSVHLSYDGGRPFQDGGAKGEEDHGH